MRCPECERKLTRGETICGGCGWRKGPANSQWGSKYEQLPACGRCSSTGVLLGPPELDKHAISVAEGAGKIPPYPFARHLYLCACSRGRLRKSLDDPQMFGAKMPKPWFKTPILTPAGELKLGEHFQVDFKWWAKECSKRGLVVRPDPKADRRTLTEVLAAPGASGHRVLRG